MRTLPKYRSAYIYEVLEFDGCDTAIKVREAFACDRHKQGIHLMQPTIREMEDAVETAIRDGFSDIYIYGNGEYLEDCRERTGLC